MGAGVVGAVAAPMIAHGIRAVQNKLTYRRDLNRLLDVRPEISGEHNERDINLAFQSMRHLNPELSKDPLTGSTLLTQILRNRDIQDPSAPPRMDLGVARELFTAERRGKDEIVETATRAFDTGVRMGIEGHRATSQARRDAAQSTLNTTKLDMAQASAIEDSARKDKEFAHKLEESKARGLESERTFKQKGDQFDSSLEQKGLDRTNRLDVARKQQRYKEVPEPYNPQSGTPEAQGIRLSAGLPAGGLRPPPRPTGSSFSGYFGLAPGTTGGSVLQRLGGKP